MGNLEHQSDRCGHEDHARTSVADKRQRDALERQESDHGPDIDERLNTEPRQHSYYD